MLTSAQWWRGLAALLTRQALQVIPPVLAVLVAGNGAVDIAGAVTAVVTALAVTLFAGFWRALRDAPDTTMLGMVVRAGAGVLAGLGVTDLASFADVDWRGAVVAALAAMAAAVVHYFADPPAGER